MRKILLVSCVLVALVSGPTMVALAQEATAPAENAESMSAGELYTLAKTYAAGDGVEQDLDRAIAIFEDLAAAGHDRSLFRLARLYLQTERFEDALNAYNQLAEGGDERAIAEMAIGHARGRFGPLSDASKGVPKLEELAASNQDERALFELAEAYYYARGTGRDLRRAFELYSELAQRDNARAHFRLGEFHRRGLLERSDPAAAISNYRAAVDAGYDKALLKLAAVQIAAGAGQEALQSLNRAVELEIGGAEAELARGHYLGSFGANSNSDFGASELKRLAKQGDLDASEFVLRLAEKSSCLSGGPELELVLANVEGAARSGDRGASEALARAYRKLSHCVPDSRMNHVRVVREYGSFMRPRTLVVEQVHATFDPEAPEASFPELAEIVRSTPADAYDQGILTVLGMDLNAFVYVMQSEMKAAGLFAGRTSGLMTRRTIKATMDFCREIDAYQTCKFGPLGRDAVRLIIAGLNERRRKE